MYYARYEFVNPGINSFKFWEAKEIPKTNKLRIEYGRIGCVNPCFGGELTFAEMAKKSREKLNKGYVRVD